VRELSGEADDLGHCPRQLGDRHVVTGADVHRRLGRVVFHQEHRGVGKIVDIEELAAWRAGAPKFDRRRARQFGAMQLDHERADDVALFEVIIVAGTIEIARHRGDEIGAVLAAIGLRHFQAGDLGDGVPLVGRLERAGEQRIFDDGLRRQPGIDARRPEK
jgi:hypothetical protein